MSKELNLEKIRNEYQMKKAELHCKNEWELIKMKNDLELNARKLYNDKEREDKEFTKQMQILEKHSILLKDIS